MKAQSFRAGLGFAAGIGFRRELSDRPQPSRDPRRDQICQGRRSRHGPAHTGSGVRRRGDDDIQLALAVTMNLANLSPPDS
jgi:hypothetical protein